MRAKDTRTFSMEKEILAEVERTKGSVSTSQRVNDLLKAGLEAERRESLHREAAAFFRENDDRVDRQAFQRASIATITRDEG